MSTPKNNLKIKRKNFFYYLNQKNLLTEIKQYGYALSMKKLLSTYFSVIIGAILAGVLFKLPPIGYFMIIATALFLTPMIIVDSYKSIYQQKKFSEVNKYIEKMLYYFQKSEKILDSLKAEKKIFSGGTMYDCISAAINYINAPNGGNIEKKALEIIEEHYPLRRVKTLHKFMVDVEYKGGDSTLGIDMLLNDRNMWVERVLEFQQEKISLKRSVIIGIVLTLCLCLSLLYLPMVTGLKNMDISKNIIVQISAAILISLLILVYYKFNSKLAKNWIEEDKTKSDEIYEKKYSDFMNYDKKKEFTKSLIATLIVLLITGTLFMFTGHEFILVFGILIVGFVLNTHKIGRNILKKDITSEINTVFPIWLLDVSLLMNNENVHMALAKSYSTAPGLLKPALKIFLQALDNKPNSSEPFNNFLVELEISEIHEAMSSLFILTTASGGDFEVELREIISRNYKLLDKAEKQKNSDKATLMNMYILIPSLIAAFKLMIDMTILLLTFLSSSSMV